MVNSKPVKKISLDMRNYYLNNEYDKFVYALFSTLKEFLIGENNLVLKKRRYWTDWIFKNYTIRTKYQ